MSLEKLYDRLPHPLQTLALSLEGWRVRRLRYGGGYRRLYESYVARTFATPEDLEALRRQRLRQLVEQAAQAVPYYQRLFRKLGLRAADIQAPADLRHLPVLSRREVQQAGRDLWAERPRGHRVFLSHTSGSTGTGLVFPVTRRAHQEQWAVWWRYRGWHGIRRGTWCLYFGGRAIVPARQRRPPYWRWNIPGRQLLFSAYHLAPDTAPHYLAQMARRCPAWFHGYPSLLALLASYALEGSVRPAATVVTTGAETLLPQQRALMREAFGVAPLEHYGMAEGVANASQCPEGNLHLDEDYAIVELLPLPGESDQFRIVGTNLTNPAFPLLRYDTDDVCTFTDRSCPCGRPGRVLDRIDGRQEDYVVTKSGVRLGRLDHLFKDLVRVREAQIVQQRPGSIEIRIVRGAGYGPPDEGRLREELRRRVGEDLDFAIVYVEAIPRTRAGKIRFVVSQLGEASAPRPTR